MFTKVRARAGGSHGPDLNQKIGSQRKASRNGAGPNPVGEDALEGRTMKLRSLLLTSAMAASVLGFATTANAADIREVQMLHWWTSGGEAAALNVLKQDLTKEGYVWKDVPVAGGGGAGAMTTLKAMVAAGNPPTASQILGYFALDYAEAGKLGDITALATKEGWDKVIPTALQKFTITNGKWDAVPVNIHSVNWIWLNKAVMEKVGGTEPKTFDDFVALLDKAKAAGVIPLALGGQPWQEATMFDSVIASTGGIDFYKKAIIDLDPAALEKTVADFNAAVQPGTFDHTILDDCRTEGLTPPKTHWARRIETPPYYAYPVRPGITFTYLGTRVNKQSRMMMKDGKPSANMFAAGEIMAGNVLGKGYAAGMGMTIGSVFGRVAGREAARNAKN